MLNKIRDYVIAAIISSAIIAAAVSAWAILSSGTLITAFGGATIADLTDLTQRLTDHTQRLTDHTQRLTDHTQRLTDHTALHNETRELTLLLTPDAAATKPKRFSFKNTRNKGVWSDPRLCPVAHYVCGLDQRVEPKPSSADRDKKDEVGMTGLRFYCCPFPRFAIQD